MGDGVEIINISAFRDCYKLTQVEIPNSVKEIRASAFYNDMNISEIELPNNLTKISSNCFYSCSFNEINIPEGVVTIEASAFSSCSKLTTVNIPNSVKTIASSAFTGCSKLTNIEIAEENTNFEFKNDILLGNAGTEIIIILESAINGNSFVVPTGVTNLTSSSLSAFPNVISVEIPATVTNLSAMFFNNNITNVVIDENNKNYMTDGKAVYDIDKKTLIRYYANDTEIVIDEGVEIIEERAFSSKKCTSVILPDSIKRIGAQAFGLCTQLKSLSLGSQVESLHGWFIYQSDIEEISIDENNPNYSIRDGALYNYDGTVFILPVKPLGTITSYEIPYGVTEIASACFMLSYNLSEITIHKPQGSIKNAPWQAPKGDKVLNWVEE